MLIEGYPIVWSPDGEGAFLGSFVDGPLAVAFHAPIMMTVPAGTERTSVPGPMEDPAPEGSQGSEELHEMSLVWDWSAGAARRAVQGLVWEFGYPSATAGLNALREALRGLFPWFPIGKRDPGKVVYVFDIDKGT